MSRHPAPHRTRARGLRLAGLAVAFLLAPLFAPQAHAQVNLSATKTATDDNGGSPRPGEVLTYTITITNSGNVAAANVVFSDPIPANTTFLPGSLTSDDPTDVLVEGNPVQVQVGGLAAAGLGDNNVVITFKVQISGGAANGLVLSNQGTITATGPISIVTDDPATGAANDATTTTVVNPLDITLTKTRNVATAAPGTNIIYTLTYQNTGSGAATNVSMADFVPANTTFVSATGGGTLSGGVVTWSIGGLAAGGSGSRQFTVSVNAGVAAGTVISNSGSISFQDNLGNTQDPKASNTVTTTVAQAAAVVAGPDQSGSIRVPTSSNITYTFTVTNNGNGNDRFDLTSIRVATPFAVQVELLNAAGTVVATDNATANGTWDTVLGSADTDSDGLPDTGLIAPGATVVYQVRITKTGGGCNGCIDITRIQATSNFNGAVNDPVTFSTTVSNNNIGISVLKTDAPDPVAGGSNIVYTITIQNTGSQPLTTVAISDSVPANTTFVSASGGGVLGGGVVTWAVGTIGAGTSTTRTLTVQVDAAVPNGTVIVNTASVTAIEITGATQATATTTVQSPVSFVTSSKTVNFAAATPGATLTYTISVVNAGISGATGVVVNDTIPANTTYVAGSITGTGANAAGNPNLVWNIGNVAGGATVNLTYQVLITNPVPAGTTTITNTASIDSNETTPITTNIATTNITASPNFTLSTKAVSDLNGGLVTTGDTLRYTIVVRNSGNMSATGVVVTDTVPANTTYVAGSITGAGADASGNPNLAWNVGAVAGAGGTSTLTFDVRIGDAVAGGTSIANVGSVDSNETAPVSTTTATTTVQAGYSGTLTATATVNPGGPVTMTLTDGNLNTNTATVQTVSLTTVNSVTGESETRTYTETGANTGIFTATVATVFGTTAGTNNDGTFNVQAGDTLVATYNDGFTATGGVATVTATTTVTSAGVSGTIGASATVLPGGAITITVTDADLNTNAATTQTVDVTVTNPTTGEVETVTLTETGVNTGVFSGTLATSQGSVPNPAVGTLAVAKDDVVTSAYADAVSGTGGPATVTANTTVIQPAMTISKTDAPDPVVAGANITYTLSYSNTGTATATGVVITDTIPANTSFVSATGGGTLAAGVVTWNIGIVAAGGSGSVQLVVQTASPLANGTLITNATYAIDSNETAPTSGAAITTTISSAPILSISKADAPDPVVAGANITYTLTFQNTGNANASGVVVTDTIPANTSFVSATAGGTLAAGVVTWNIGALNAGASSSVQLVVQTSNPLANGTLITNATYAVDSNETAPTSGAAITTTISSMPVLSISKADAPDPVVAGANITYTLTFQNTGNANASGVVVTDTIPANTSFVSATAGGALAAGVVTWNIGALNAGASSSVQLVVQTSNPLANGTLITNATYAVDSNETLPVSGAAITTTISSAPVLSISKADAPDPVVAGTNITYTLTFQNTGNANASGVVVTDTIPANTSFVSASGGGALAAGVVTWNIGALNAGSSASRTLTVQVASPLANGTLITNATYAVDSNETLPVSGAAITTTVSSAPALSISKTDAPDPVPAGANITYSLSYSNTGTDAATGVVITDTIPANTTFVSATAGGTLAAGVVTWNIGGLAAGGSGSVQLVVQVDSPLANGTIITNGTYAIDCNETAPVGGAAVTTTVTSDPILNVSKTDGPDPAVAGTDNITYTISYSNTGTANATGVVITDTVPAGATFVSATAGGTLAAGVVTWNIGGVLAGASGSVQLVVSINTPVANGATITNGTYAINCNETAAVGGAAATTTILSDPRFTLTKVDAPDPVAAGANITYTFNYSNVGTNNATGVVIQDTLPANTSFVSATGGGTLAAGVVTWNVGAVNSGSSGSVQLVVQVASPLLNGTVITNTGWTIDSNESLPQTGPDANTTVTSAPVLSISKADAPDPVLAGANITYTLNYSNTGNANATGVVIADTIPGNTSFVSATGGGTLATGVVTWNIGALAAGASASVQLVVQVTSPLANGTVLTNATYSIDSNETAATAGAAITTTVNSVPVLAVTKADAPDPVVAGANLTYTLAYQNTGNANATGVVITDTVPPNTSFVSATGGGTLAAGVVTWNIGALAVGGSGSVQLVVQVASPLANGTVITNGTFAIDSNETAPAAGAAITTTVSSAPILSISKADAPDPVNAGSALTYTLSYQNTGNANATGVVVTDTVPPNTSFVSATGGGTLAAGVVTWNIGALAAGGSGSVQMIVQVASPLVNGTVLTNATYAIDSVETAAVAGAAITTTVSSAPVLTLTKSDAPDPVSAGANITYTINYSNTGNANATGVVITDTIPVNTSFVSATGGGALAAGVVTWNVGGLAAGASASVQLVVQVTTPIANGTIITNGSYQIASNETAPTAGGAVTTTVTSAPVMTISKTDAPDPVTAGNNITYTLSYSNTGTADATGVVITDTIPANTSFVSATGGGALAAGVVTWNVGVVTAGASGTRQLVVQTASPLANGTLITNGTYAIDSNETAPTSGAAITTTISSAPILAISKTDAPDPVVAGANITYTLSFQNTGNANASGVVVTDTIPANTSFVSASGGGTLAAGVVTWNVGALNAGASASRTLTVQVATPLANGTLITNATYAIDSNETPPVSGAAITTTVSSAPVLAVSKTDAPDPVNAGASITYTLSFQNTGNANASGVVITDTIPASTSFVSATGGGTLAAGVVTWNIGALNAGASSSVQLVVQTASPLGNGTIITNGAYAIDSNETAPLSGASVATTVNSTPVLTISKTDGPDPVAAGASITYTINYANSGNENASGVLITDTIPANTSFVSATGGGTLAAGVVTWNIGAMAAGGSGLVQLVVQVASPLSNGTTITNATYAIDSNETVATSGAAVTTTVTSAPVLSISKSDAPDPVAAGANITYTLTFQNSGNENASGVVVTDTVPANTSFVSASGGGTVAAGVVTWNIGILAAGASASRTLTVQVASPLLNGTVITNATYAIDSVETAPVAGAAITTTVTSSPILSVSKTDSPDPVPAGANVTYTLSYANTGNANATGVVIADTVPANTAFVSATGGGTLAAGVVTWNIGGLAAGASSTVQMVVQVNSPLPNGTIITNGTYSIDSNETAPAAGAAATTTVTSDPILNVSKTDGPDPAVAGTDNITYTISYSNTGNSNATGTLITDTIPAGTTFVSATGGGTLAAGVVTWNLGGVAAGASGSVQLVVSIDTPVANGAIITNGTYAIDCSETAPVAGAAATTTVLSDVRFTLTKSDAPDPVAAGANITYTLDYTNSGTSNATGVVLTDPIPANTSFVSATGGGTLAAGVVSWNIGNVNAGVSGSRQLVVQVTSPLANGTVITNTGWTVDSNESLPETGPDAVTAVTSSPALNISKTDAPDPVTPGGTITYTISYSNTGNENATGVVITDAVPANTSFVSATGGGTLAGGNVTWNIGALNVGASGSLQLVVQVNTPLANGTVISNATYQIDCNEAGATAGAAVTTTVSSAPVLTVSKTDAPDPVNAGSNITYTIQYANGGTANATGVVLTDTIPANTSFVSATGGGTLAAGVVTWNLGVVAAGASGSVQLVVQVTTPLANGTIITNGAFGIDSNETAPVAGAAVTTTVNSVPVLNIGKLSNPDPVAAGATITYTLTWTNTGTANATGVVVTDTVPANTTFVSATGGGALAAGVVTWNVGVLAAGGSGSEQMVVQVASPLVNGTLIANTTYAIDSIETPPNSGVPASSTVTSGPVLAASKAFTDLNGGSLRPGDIIQYAVTVTNSGNGIATNVVLSDAIPANTAYVPGSLLSDDPADILTPGNPLTVGIGSLGADPDVVVTFRVQVNSPLANGTVVSNQASIAADGPLALVSDDPSTVAANDATARAVTSAPALAATKTAVDDNGGPLFEGDMVTYTITVTNSGDADATAVSLSDAIPANTTLVPGSLSSDDPADAETEGNPLTVDVGTLPGAGGGDSDVQITFQVLLDTPLAGGTVIANQGMISAAGGISLVTDDPSTGAANDATALTVSASGPILAVEQTVVDVNGGSLNPGDLLTYTTVVRNSGFSAATAVVVTDPVPASTTYVPGSIAGTGADDSGAPALVWNVGGIAPGATVTLLYQVTVDALTPGGTIITNQARLDATGIVNMLSDDPAVNDGAETGNSAADPGDDDPTRTSAVFLGDILQVSITADAVAVRRGDFVLYTLVVTNPTALPVAGVDLSDRLPVGVRLVPGTVTLDGVAVADPAPGVPALMVVGVVNPSASRTIVYRAVVTAGAGDTEMITRVFAQDPSAQILSSTATATVVLLEDAEFDLGTIVGKVFDDKNGDGVQQAGERGIGGAMVAMEDGVYATTDANGMYHIAAVRPGNRLVKVNTHTLPPHDGLTLPEAQTVTLTPGLLTKVNFGVKAKPPTTIKQGSPGTYGIAVQSEKVEAEAEVIGNLEDMTAVVNGVQARLPKARARMDIMSLERNLRIVNGRLEKPGVFKVAYPKDRAVKEWVFEIFDASMRRVRGFRGTDLKTTEIVWDGKDASGALVRGGAIYQYQLTIQFADGSLSKSPVRMFGVNRTNAISFELTGASFDTNTARLNASARPVLEKVAETLKKYPDEKVVVRGHTDNTGDSDWNFRLSVQRAEAVRDFLTAAGIATDQLIVEGRGAAAPVAPNSTAAGRARNRRVEIKALLEDTERARIYAGSAGTAERQVVVNGRTVTAEEDGSFRTVVDPIKDGGRVYVGIRTEDGGVAATTVTLPTIAIIQPTADVKVEIGRREDVIKLMQPTPGPNGLSYPTVKIPVVGRTEPGNQVFIDGAAVQVDPRGVFRTDLPLAVGENTFGVVAMAPNGYTSVVNLAVALTGLDRSRDIVTVRKPVPQFSIELPPRGAVLSSPQLFVRGTAPARATVSINGWRIPIAPNNTFAGSVRLPEGPSVINVVVSMPNSTEGRVGVPVEVKSDYFFLVALGDATVNKITTEGRVPDKFEDDLYVDGRVAFYLKGRIQGKYLITAGLDTGDGRLSDIGSRLDDRDPGTFTRNLDPDAFYPVYGDGSRTYDDTNTQGRFYVLFDAPSGSFQWGNYNSGITGNEFASFNRSLYGGKGTWRTLKKGKDGLPLGQALVFAAVPETRAAHDEFTGTGGSLFFLRNNHVVPGSEKVRLEVRDKISNLTVANVTRRNYVDYEIDYAEGRILFRAPVSSVTDTSTIISDGLLNGNPVFVIVDYEFSDPSAAAMDDATYGARVRQAVGDAVTVGATYVQEDRQGATYTLEGGDVTVRAGDAAQVVAEFSRSENDALAQFVSTDGGLNFAPRPSAGPDGAQAYRVEFTAGKGRVRATGYARHLDAGFSSSYATAAEDTDQYGATLGLRLGQTSTLNVLLDSRELAGVSTLRTGTLQYVQTFGKFGITAEARYRALDDAGLLAPDVTEGIGALRFDYRPTKALDLYVRHQDDFLNDSTDPLAVFVSKRQTAIGMDARLGHKVTARAELIDADVGDGALVGIQTKIDERSVLYGTYTMSPDQPGGVTGVLTVGAATTVGDRTRLYTEEQFKTTDRDVTTTNVVGMSTRLGDRVTTSVGLERTRLDGTGALPDTTRQAASAGVGYAGLWLKVYTKLEMRQDEGTATDRRQWVASNAVEFRPHRDFTFAGRFNYGVTENRLVSPTVDETIFREQSFGVTYRPVAHDWVQILARYTQIRNLPPDRPVIVEEEKTDQVVSLQTVIDLHRRVTLTEKFAVRDRAIDQALVADLKSRMKLWINRFNYHLSDTWDAALEYRTLMMDEGGDNQADGFLLEINRLFLKHLRVGVGYNFTDFTDNEFTTNDYSAKGFFFRIQGKY